MPSESSAGAERIDVFNAENEFYRRCSADRISKFLAHATLYEMSLGLPGHFAEAGVFTGTTLSRSGKLVRLFHPAHTRRFAALDLFGRFPAAPHGPDQT